ncbi:hypothetical protein ACJMQP_27510, partial [Rhodopseudomonas palustris]
ILPLQPLSHPAFAAALTRAGKNYGKIGARCASKACGSPKSSAALQGKQHTKLSVDRDHTPIQP